MGLDLSSGPDVSVVTGLHIPSGRVVFTQPLHTTATEMRERERAYQTELRERIARTQAEFYRKVFRDQTHMDKMYAAAEKARRAGAMGEAKHTLELGTDDYEVNSGVRGDNPAERQAVALSQHGRQDSTDKS